MRELRRAEAEQIRVWKEMAAEEASRKMLAKQRDA